jgi:DNA-binding Lrp family transcriptional regulator
MKLDETDEVIISELQKDGRISYSKIAEKVGKTEVTIRRRVKRLHEEEKIIKKFTVIIDPLKMGKKIRAIIRAKTVMKEASAISSKLHEFEEVTEAYFLDGACGLIMMVTVDDFAHLKRFLEESLGGVPGVGDAETCIVLEEIKSPYDDESDE